MEDRYQQESPSPPASLNKGKIPGSDRQFPEKLYLWQYIATIQSLENGRLYTWDDNY